MPERAGKDATAGGWTLIGPVSYEGKDGCQDPRCRVMSDGEGGWRCIGYHCCYCDEPCSYQGHGCDAADAALGEARRQAES